VETGRVGATGLHVARMLKLELTAIGVNLSAGSNTALYVPAAKALSILTVPDDGAALHEAIPHVKTNTGYDTPPSRFADDWMRPIQSPTWGVASLKVATTGEPMVKHDLVTLMDLVAEEPVSADHRSNKNNFLTRIAAKNNWGGKFYEHRTEKMSAVSRSGVWLGRVCLSTASLCYRRVSRGSGNTTGVAEQSIMGQRRNVIIQWWTKHERNKHEKSKIRNMIETKTKVVEYSSLINKVWRSCRFQSMSFSPHWHFEGTRQTHDGALIIMRY